jgi:hypothetical protein
MKEALPPSLLTSLTQQVKSWFEQAKTPEPEEDLVALPDTVQAQLAQKLQALPSPAAYQTAIQADITAAVQAWRQNLDAPNSLIFLGNPVEPIAKILTDSLAAWSDAPVQVVTPLPCLARPQDPLTMAQQHPAGPRALGSRPPQADRRGIGYPVPGTAHDADCGALFRAMLFALHRGLGEH